MGTRQPAKHKKTRNTRQNRWIWIVEGQKHEGNRTHDGRWKPGSSSRGLYWPSASPLASPHPRSCSSCLAISAASKLVLPSSPLPWSQGAASVSTSQASWPAFPCDQHGDPSAHTELLNVLGASVFSVLPGDPLEGGEQLPNRIARWDHFHTQWKRILYLVYKRGILYLSCIWTSGGRLRMDGVLSFPVSAVSLPPVAASAVQTPLMWVSIVCCQLWCLTHSVSHFFLFQVSTNFQGFIHQLLLSGRIFEASKFFAFFDLTKLGLEDVQAGPPWALPALPSFLCWRSRWSLISPTLVFSPPELSELSASLGFPSGSFSSSFPWCSWCSES